MNENGLRMGAKARALYDWITENIDNGFFEYESKLPSENMLCIKFNISRQTVKNAFAELERSEYIERFKGKGSFVKKKVVTNHVNTIGVCLSYLEQYMFPSVIEGIEEVFSKNGYGIDLGLGQNRVDIERLFLKRMLDMNVSGLIVEGIKTAFPNPNTECYSQLIEAKIPVVFIHNHYVNFKAPSVVMDDEKIMYEETRMLIEAGHRKIGGLFKFDDMQGIKRYAGFIKALIEHEIKIDDRYVCWYEGAKLDDRKERIRSVMDNFAEDIIGNCTAIACYNDVTASFVIKRLVERGVNVPEDISIVACDNSSILGGSNIRLTSAQHPKKEMGKYVSKVLMDLIEHPYKIKEEKVTHVLPTDIIIGNSIRNINE
ncbi:MAG: GntR family transcriptional regulator [Prevotella sp.]|jgi:GntR family transcriptional regulator of arabinose operon|nr:GntR family transcriptional regulator [Prevotella sp.]